MAPRVRHSTTTAAAANPNVLVDGPKWDADHTVEGAASLAGGNAFTGSQTIAPAAGTLDQGLVVTQSGPASGSVVGPYSSNLINATFSSTVTGSTDPFFDFGAWQTSATAFRVNFTVGGANLSGEPFNAGMFQTRLTTAAAPTGDGDFIGCIGAAHANVVSTNSTLHGLAGGASINTGASIRAMNGLFSEVDVIGTGVVGQRRGLTIASQAQGTATGSVDTGLYIASTYTSGAFKKWTVFDASAFQTTADIFWATGAQTVANVFNLPSMTVTGNILNFPNVTLSGAGVLVAGGGTADANTGAMVTAAIPSGGKAALISQVDGTSAFSGLHVQNAAITSVFFAAVPDASSTATILGQTAANWTEFVSAGASSNGILFGTLTTKPVVFGTSNTERMRLLLGLSVGTTTDPGSGAILANASIKSQGATAGIGYATGAGGTVTQATSKATGVTLNTVSGQITLNNAALAAATIVSFVLTDSAVAATDVLILNHISGGTPGSYSLNARAAAGSATIDVRNNTAGSLSEAIVIQFALIKAVNA